MIDRHVIFQYMKSKIYIDESFVEDFHCRSTLDAVEDFIVIQNKKNQTVK